MSVMVKKFIVALFFIPGFVYAIGVTGGQGYGVFRLSGGEANSLASVMTASIKFNRYIAIKYLSLDTSFRMPVLPLRLVDIKYGQKPNGQYTSYDSDVFGLSLTLPFNDFVELSAFYGLGRSRIYAVTETAGSDPTATIHKGLIHAFNSELTFNIPVWKVLMCSPGAGVIMHFLDKDSAYSNALSWYLALSVSYIL